MQSPLELWQVRRATLISWDCTRPVASVPLPHLTSFSEMALATHAQLVRQMETLPPYVPQFPIGSWAVDRFGEVYQLRCYALDDPILWFPEGDPFGRFRPLGVVRRPAIIEKYVGWLRAGHEPPPCTAIEMESRRIKITEGHHRAESLVQDGRTTCLIWVSPIAFKAAGISCGLTHKLAVEQALEAGYPVPHAVLADYPELYRPAFALLWPQ